jgi:hypothetical protein
MNCFNPALIVICAFAATSCGCSQSEFVPVEGQVLYKEQPLKSGVIMFQPPNGPPARADIVAGDFKLETLGGEAGARIGLNKVRIASREMPAGGDVEMALGKSLIPERYGNFESSGLTADVKPDGNEPFVFRLTD